VGPRRFLNLGCWGSRQRLAPVNLPPENSPGAHCRRGCVSPRRFLNLGCWGSRQRLAPVNLPPEKSSVAHCRKCCVGPRQFCTVWRIENFYPQTFSNPRFSSPEQVTIVWMGSNFTVT